YTDNEFAGNDRIADENLLTLGLGTRFLDAGTNAQIARFDVAQRIRFKDQHVVLPGETPATERLSDLLLGASVNWTSAWATDATFQYNPKSGRSERTTIGARYNPAPYHVLSAAYRRQSEQQPLQSEQLDLGWQWPLNDFGRQATYISGQGGGEGR